MNLQSEAADSDCCRRRAAIVLQQGTVLDRGRPAPDAEPGDSEFLAIRILPGSGHWKRRATLRFIGIALAANLV